MSIPDRTSSGYAKAGDCDRGNNDFIALSRSASESINLDTTRLTGMKSAIEIEEDDRLGRVVRVFRSLVLVFVNSALEE